MIPLLPYEKYLASQLGVSEEQYQQFKAITLLRSFLRPARPPVAGFLAPLVPFLVNLAIGVGVSLISSLLFPPRRQGQIISKQKGGEALTSNQRLSPRYGFNAIQEPARVGQLIPIVVAKRENGYGGVRVNMPMIWSQMLSTHGSQMFRGIFLAGAATMSEDAWDMRGWAFGNNTLGAYAFFGPGDTEGGRFTIYYRPSGGRVTGEDQIAGKRADKDLGNFEELGGEDVFSIFVRDEIYEPAFCMAEAPSTSTKFGLYGWCPNAMAYKAATRVGPTIRPRVGGAGSVNIDDDLPALAEIWKGKWNWSMRGGLIEYKADGSGEWTTVVPTGYGIQGQDVEPGDRLRYYLSADSDRRTRLGFTDANTDIEPTQEAFDDSSFILKVTEVAAGVAAIQNSADSSLIPGELYRIGSCWAVLEDRQTQNDLDLAQPETIFVSSQSDSKAKNSMKYVFIVVKPGRVQFVGPELFSPVEQGFIIVPPRYYPETDLALLSSDGSIYYDIPVDEEEGSGEDPVPIETPAETRYKVCSTAAQVFRMAIASVGAVREVSIMEIGFRSRVGISVNGMTEFRSCPTVQQINQKAGLSQEGDEVGNKLRVAPFTSNSLTTKLIRYSAFTLEYRTPQTDWVQFDEIFAIGSNTAEDIYNYIRIEFPSPNRWEVRFVPISSWEIRKGDLDGDFTDLIVLDSFSEKQKRTSDAGVRVMTNGRRRGFGNLRKLDELENAATDPDGNTIVDIGLGLPDPSPINSVIDGYGAFAEGFCYDEVRSSVDNGPEHEIVYVNYPSDLDKTPSYEKLAIVGINIAASLEFTNLQQFSGFCINGYEMRRLLNSDTKGASHLFPDWLRELMTSPDVGPQPPLPDSLINRASFEAAAQWCQDRNYFYDSVEGEPLSILGWASDVAQAHLLKLVKIGGVFFLKKAFEFEEPMPVAGLFTNGNIVEESFKLETGDYQSRQPFAVEVKWREESNDTENPLFARERVALVAEVLTGAGIDRLPVESLDLSGWCTNQNQAIDAACYLLRFRRLSNHRVSFDITPDMMATPLASGSIIKVAVDVVNYDKAVQGFITESGKVVTTRPDLAPTEALEYPALIWDGDGEPQEATVVISESGAASPPGVFFAIASPQTSMRTYEISKISLNADGVVSVEAFYHPTNESGVSLFGLDWTTYESDGNWSIIL